MISISSDPRALMEASARLSISGRQCVVTIMENSGLRFIVKEPRTAHLHQAITYQDRLPGFVHLRACARRANQLALREDADSALGNPRSFPHAWFRATRSL